MHTARITTTALRNYSVAPVNEVAPIPKGSRATQLHIRCDYAAVAVRFEPRALGAYIPAHEPRQLLL